MQRIETQLASFREADENHDRESPAGDRISLHGWRNMLRSCYTPSSIASGQSTTCSCERPRMARPLCADFSCSPEGRGVLGGEWHLMRSPGSIAFRTSPRRGGGRAPMSDGGARGTLFLTAIERTLS